MKGKDDADGKDDAAEIGGTRMWRVVRLGMKSQRSADSLACLGSGVCFGSLCHQMLRIGTMVLESR
jgi:hypothetical protein